MWAARSVAFALVCVISVLGSTGVSALEELRGLRAGYLYGNQTGLVKLSKPDSSVCSYTATCSAGGYAGTCLSVSAGCCSGGTVTSGLCPGSSDVECCTLASCSTPSGTGQCMSTSQCSGKGGKSLSGYCTGPSSLQCCITGSTSAELGYDVSSTLSASTAACMESTGYTFVVPRGYKSTGAVDTNVCNNIKSGFSAGAVVRDAYLFPCPTCSSESASTQMSQLVSYLKSNCATQWSGRVWLDIEASQNWLGSYSSNQAWYQALVGACSTYGINCGIYTNSAQWQSIFGSTSYTYGNNLPLWYAHYDNNPSFSDFSAFAGWTTPHAKQYAGDATVCGEDVDLNYSPKF